MQAKKKIIILSIIFGAITALLIGFAAFPLYKGIKKDLAELINVKKELVMSKEEAGKFEQFRDTYEKNESDLIKIDQFFIDPDVPIDLIKFWEKTANSCCLSITVSPVSLKSEKGAPWNSIGFQVNLTGLFSNFSKFLEKTESGPYLIEIQRLILSKLKDNEEEGIGGVRVNLSARVFAK